MKNYSAANIRNIALIGHGGSGKTTLAEAILYRTKVIGRMGKTPDGNTVLDFDAEEIRRGISINTSVATCEWRDCKLNLIDTPGDFDFLGEQMQGMAVSDANLIVMSAKDGLSVGAEKAVRQASKKDMPIAFVVNRLDEPHADFGKTVQILQEAYGSKVVPLSLPIFEKETLTGVVDVVKQTAVKFDAKGASEKIDIPADLADIAQEYFDGLQEQIAMFDEELMEKFFEGEPFTEEEERRGVRQAILSGSLWPVFATTGLNAWGIAPLLDSIVDYFPSPDQKESVKGIREDGSEFDIPFDPDGPLAAFIFKTIVDPFVGRISLFRVYSGKISSSTTVYNADKHKDERIGGVLYLVGKKQLSTETISAGDIGAVTKLLETTTNDTLSDKSNPLRIKPINFPVPCLTLAVSPKVKGEEDKIMQGLNKLRDEDLVFDIVNDPETRQLLLSGLGEVQLDVLCSKLKSKFDVEAVLSEPRVAYRETIRKKVKVQGRHKKQTGGHGQYGDVWIEFEPGETEALDFSEKIFGGSVPKNYHPAVEKGLQEAVEKGVLAGYPVVNLKATLVDGSYHDVDSSEMSFKLAARLAYRNGLPQADPILLEPISTVHVHIPDDYLGDVMGDLNKRRGRILGINPDAETLGFQIVDAEAPTSELAKYATDLKSMTQGRGWYTIEFCRYEPAPSNIAEKVIAAAEAAEDE